jgi:hypothetical protein
MSIPIDRLYQYIEKTIKHIHKEHVVIYRFWPHGSKKIENLTPLEHKPAVESFMLYSKSFLIYCHDQEPLDHDLYENLEWAPNLTLTAISRRLGLYVEKNIEVRRSFYDRSALIHSEARSKNLEKYQQQFITIYYWSHAVIALDWFRFAQHIDQTKQVQKTFLIYNRAWSGSREYRLRFADLLINHNLQNCCRTSIAATEPELGIHYSQHGFKNPVWRPVVKLEDYFPPNTAASHYSADFDIADYNATDIEVVLETLFDDERLHLTEKSLRPIACGQPFILAATHGSLEYLRGHGFRTFSEVWDEDYDQIVDPQSRLFAVVKVMKQISQWDDVTRQQKMIQAQSIADHNRRHFFSEDFFKTVVSELQDNILQAVGTLQKTNTFTRWPNHWQQLLNHPDPELTEYLDNTNNVPNRVLLQHLMGLVKSKQAEIQSTKQQ